jgi:hypothetical protein
MVAGATPHPDFCLSSSTLSTYENGGVQIFETIEVTGKNLGAKKLEVSAQWSVTRIREHQNRDQRSSDPAILRCFRTDTRVRNSKN